MKYIVFLLISINIFALEQQVGIVKYVEGKVYRITSDARDELLNKGDSIYSSDLINTQKGKLLIKFNDETDILLSKKTKLSIKKFIVNKNESKRFAMLKLTTGDIKVNVNRKFGNNLFEIDAGYITLEIKGTSFYLSNHSNKVDILLIKGIVSIKSILDKFNKLRLTQNKIFSITGEGAPKISGLNMGLLNNVKLKFRTLKNQENKNTKKFNSFSEGKIVTFSDKYISQMRSILSNAYSTLRKVRKEKNIIKLNCVNGSVMTIKGHLRRSEDNKIAIDEALAKSDLKTSRTLISKIYSSYNEVKQAEILMKSCTNDVVGYDGNKNISLNIEEIIVHKDYTKKQTNPMDISYNKQNDTETNVDLEPIQASPYF